MATTTTINAIPVTATIVSSSDWLIVDQFNGSGYTTKKCSPSVLTNFISPLTTKGDLFGFNTANARIPVGSNGQILTADSTTALGVKWNTLTIPVTSVFGRTGDVVAVNTDYYSVNYFQTTSQVMIGDTATIGTHFQIKGFTDGSKALNFGVYTSSTPSFAYFNSMSGGSPSEIKFQVMDGMGGLVSIGLDISTPAQSLLDINGDISLTQITTPSAPRASTGRIYPKSDGYLYYQNTSSEQRISGPGINSPLTTKGDIYGFSTVNARIPVGTDGQVLTANSANALGVSWENSNAYTGSNGIQLVGSDFQFDPNYSPSFLNLTLSGIASSASITGPAVLNLISTSTMTLITTQLVLNPSNAVTVNSQLYLNDNPLYIGSNGNNVMKLDWDNTNLGMYIDSLDGVGGSSQLWINPTAQAAGNGNVGIAFATNSTLQSRLSVNGDIFLANITTPTTPTGGGKLYAKSDKNLYFLNSDGTETNLTVIAGGGEWFKFSPSVGLYSLRITDWNAPNPVSGIRLDWSAGPFTQDIQVDGTDGNLYVTNTDGISRNITGTTAVTITSNYSNTGNEDLILCNPSSNITITLDGTLICKPLTIKIMSTSFKTTVQSTGGQTFDGVSQTFVLNPQNSTGAYGEIELIADQSSGNMYLISGETGRNGGTISYNIDFMKQQLITQSVMGLLGTDLNSGGNAHIVIPYTFAFTSVFNTIQATVTEPTNFVGVAVTVLSVGLSSATVKVENLSPITIPGGNITVGIVVTGL